MSLSNNHALLLSLGLGAPAEGRCQHKSWPGPCGQRWEPTVREGTGCDSVGAVGNQSSPSPSALRSPEESAGRGSGQTPGLQGRPPQPGPLSWEMSLQGSGEGPRRCRPQTPSTDLSDTAYLLEDKAGPRVCGEDS